MFQKREFIMIRYIIMFIVFIPTVSLAQSSSHDKKVDLFLKQKFDFMENQMDSIYSSDKDYQAALEEQPRTMDFFERLTGIEAEIFHGYAYGKILQQKTINSWKEWTKQNRKLLTWDTLRSTVNRIDRDIYK